MDICSEDPVKFTFALLNSLKTESAIELKIQTLLKMSGVITFEGALFLLKWKPPLSNCPNPIKSALIYAKCLSVLSQRFPSFKQDFNQQI